VGDLTLRFPTVADGDDFPPRSPFLEDTVNMPTTSARLLDGTVHISARGDVDLDTAYLIRDAVDRALAADKPAGIVIDIALVTLIDSVGIGTLVSCFHTAAASGVRLVVTNASTMVYRQLWASGLVGLLGLPTPTADSARRAATGAAV
jgi:anti-anti-sigma factor